MAANPLVVQGTLNRIIGSVSWVTYPGLNVTAPYLGKDGIRLALEGEATLFIPTMTGTVTSPEPYQMITLTMHLLKTQPLASFYKLQQETTSLLGNGSVVPDTVVLPPYPVTNCAIESVVEQNYSGTDAGWVVKIKGYYIINSNLWNLTS